MKLKTTLNNVYYKLKNKSLDINNIDKYMEVAKDKLSERYIRYYLFLYYGFDIPHDEFIDFLKQSSQLETYDNYIISSAIEFIILLKNIIKSSSSYDEFKSTLSTFQEKYNKLIDLINSIDKTELINKLFEDATNIKHNIISLVIIYLVFNILDKEKVEDTKISSMLENAEYIYIEIAVHTAEKNLATTFKNLFLIPNAPKQTLDDIKNLILEHVENYKIIKENNHEQQFEDIIKNNDELLPVTEDFMRYHRAQEDYSVTNETKIRYIINKINCVKNINISTDKTSAEMLYYKPLRKKEYITYNELEEARLINKLTKYKDVVDYNLLNSLLTYRQYSFINYEVPKHTFIKLCPSIPIQCIRSVDDVTIRMINEINCGHVIGLCYKPKHMLLETIKQSNIKIVNYDELTNLIKNKSSDYLYVWLFSNNLDDIWSKILKLKKFSKQPEIITKQIRPIENIKLKKTKFNLPHVDLTYYDIESIDKTAKSNVKCKHVIDWENISDSDSVMAFLQHYSVINKEGAYICKSCNSELDISKYVFIGSHVEELDKYLTATIEISGKLEDIPKYDKHRKTIKVIERILQNISYNLHIMDILGDTPMIKQQRKARIKNILDTILETLELLRLHTADNTEYYIIHGIKKELSIVHGFELTDTIYINIENNTDYSKTIKYNNIVLFTMLQVFLEMSPSQIIYFEGKTKFNILLFEKAKSTFFNELFFRVDKFTKISLANIPQFAYAIFYIAGVLVTKNIWQYNKTQEKSFEYEIQVHLSIIHSFLDLVNRIMIEGIDGFNSFYKPLRDDLYTKIKQLTEIKLTHGLTKKKTIIVSEQQIQYNKLSKIEREQIKEPAENIEKIDEFINILENYTEGGSDINLKKSYYILKHNYKSKLLNQPLKIPFNNIKYIDDLIEIKIELNYVYYDKNTLQYIGYYYKSIQNVSDIIRVTADHVLIPFYSIRDCLLLLGCTDKQTCYYRHNILCLLIPKLRSMLAKVQYMRIYNNIQIDYIILDDVFQHTRYNCLDYILKSFVKLININENKNIVCKIICSIILDVLNMYLLNINNKTARGYNYLLEIDSNAIKNDILVDDFYEFVNEENENNIDDGADMSDDYDKDDDIDIGAENILLDD